MVRRRSCTLTRCGTTLQYATWRGHVAHKSGRLRESIDRYPAITYSATLAVQYTSGSPAGPKTVNIEWLRAQTHPC